MANVPILTEVTKSQIDTLIQNGELNSLLNYKITDRGDRGIILKAVSNNMVEKSGIRMMLCPATYLVTIDSSGNDWIGVWNDSKSVAQDQLTIWGGLVWKNLTGAIGTSVSDILLDDINWVLIPKASFSNNEYVEKIFNVDYDLQNDWISRQYDDNGNVFGISYAEDQTYNFGYNLVDVSDWNYGTINGYFFGNNCMGIYNNSCSGYIYNNLITGRIYDNSNVDDISNNRDLFNIYSNSNGAGITGNKNGGSIYGNSNSGSIKYNSNNGDIYDNSNSGAIEYNKNTWDIYGNTNNGDISTNSNNGDIKNNSSIANAAVSIYNNSNNGNISGAWGSNVSDAAVNKTGS